MKSIKTVDVLGNKARLRFNKNSITAYLETSDCNIKKEDIKQAIKRKSESLLIALIPTGMLLNVTIANKNNLLRVGCLLLTQDHIKQIKSWAKEGK